VSSNHTNKGLQSLGPRSKGKTILFLSWIGNHDPVTSSTTTRWIKTCLQEAGIDIGVFRAHSTREAASSLVWSDSFQYSSGSDWSSESTFLKFYHRSFDTNNKSLFGKAVLASAGTSNVHVDMETEPSEM